MNKTKNTPTLRHKITTIFGYSLFGLMVLSFLLTTMLPMTSALQYPTARHFNIILLVIVFAVATILPALAAYFIGDKSTRSKKGTLHHYNGVLFGFAAYWVAMLMNWVGFSTVFGISDQPYPAPLIATNVIPVVLTIVAMTILAIIFAKKQKKNTSVLQFVPYQLVLIVSIAGTFIAPYIGDGSRATFASIGSLAIPAVVIAIAYVVLRGQGLGRLARLSDALIAMTIGWVSVWVVESCFSFSQLPYQTTSTLSYTAALIAFGGYLYLRVRK